MTPFQLRSRREALGLSMEALARRLGISVTTVYRWESGRTELPPMLSLAMAEVERRARE